MRLLFVADGRSSTSLSWMRHWLENGYEVHLVSTYPCEAFPGLASFHILPVAFGRKTLSRVGDRSSSSHRMNVLRGFRGLLMRLRSILGPLSVLGYKRRFSDLVSDIQPDLVHALRIPFEGMLAKNIPLSIPLIISIWGNDLTLHAKSSFLMARWTRLVLERADGLLSDTIRDTRLACDWGFSAKKPTLVVPGAGGILTDRMNNGDRIIPLPEELAEDPIVVNPRGQRPGSLRQDVFFQSIPLVLEKIPRALFICPSLAGDTQAEKWVEALEIGSRVRLWPRLAQQTQLWNLLRKSQVFVSPSLHDGTPNSLLEAMACGCFPVVGDIESMREWIQPGVNGLLVDANSARSLAEAMISALQDPTLRRVAKKENARIIAERADHTHCMAMVEAFYQKIIEMKTSV